MEKRLYRSREHKVFGGVCAGLGKYFNMDFVLIRLIFMIGLFIPAVDFIIFLTYVALWIAAPLEPVIPIVEPVNEPVKDGYQPTDNLDTSNPPNEEQK